MNTSTLPQVRTPRHMRRGQVQQVLCRLLRQQETFALEIWELFNSLGYRLDSQVEEMAKTNERLWALEHPRRRHCGQ